MVSRVQVYKDQLIKIDLPIDVFEKNIWELFLCDFRSGSPNSSDLSWKKIYRVIATETRRHLRLPWQKGATKFIREAKNKMLPGLGTQK